MTVKYRVGNLDIAVLSDGLYYQDAGAVFGIIPKLMWEKVSPPLDRHHRVPLGLNSLLVRSADKLVLIETGMGDKGNDRRLASPLADGNLLSELDALGVRPADIDIVINTHLHADHCGWNTRMLEGALVPTFPNAEYVVTRAEWDAAMEPDERTRGTYFADNLAPLQEHDRLNLVEGETQLTDELTIVPTPGHSAGPRVHRAQLRRRDGHLHRRSRADGGAARAHGVGIVLRHHAPRLDADEKSAGRAGD